MPSVVRDGQTDGGVPPVRGAGEPRKVVRMGLVTVRRRLRPVSRP
jgi:hypothetical protein